MIIIKCQNGYSIGKYDNLSLTGDNLNYVIGCDLSNGTDSTTLLGVYPTKERALEVLGEIERYIGIRYANERIMTDSVVASCSTPEYSELKEIFMVNAIFTMPKE